MKKRFNLGDDEVVDVMNFLKINRLKEEEI